MSNDTLDFLSPVDRVRVLALRDKGRVGHKVLIAVGVAVTVVLMAVSVWLGPSL